MTIREITFDGIAPSPGMVLRALEILGLEGKATLKGPLKRNGEVVGCLVRFNADADADKFVAAWKGFLDLKKGGKPAFAFAPSLPPLPLPSLDPKP
jgi:hypothetical protein